MHSSIFIASQFIEQAESQCKVLTPMKLLKLVYIAHGFMLGLYGRPLVNDEIQAWKYGPVIPELYDAIRQFRDKPVTALPVAASDQLDELETDLIRQVFDYYGHLSGPALSRLTHEQGSPWHIVYYRNVEGYCDKISDNLIMAYYSGLTYGFRLSEVKT